MSRFADCVRPAADPDLTLHRRDETGWTVLTAGPGAGLRLSSLRATISVDDVYRDGLEDTGP